MTAALQEARDAYQRHDWVRAHAGFTQAQSESPLTTDDLSALADAAWWLGRSDKAAPRQRMSGNTHAAAPQWASLSMCQVGRTPYC